MRIGHRWVRASKAHPVTTKPQHSRSAVTLHRVAADCFKAALRFFEVARVLVRLDVALAD
jgi:hypothetical protein